MRYPPLRIIILHILEFDGPLSKQDLCLKQFQA